MRHRPVRRGRLRVVRGAPDSGSTSASSGTPAWAAAASLVLPGFGQFLQGRRRAAVAHMVTAATLYLVASYRAWPPSFQIGALLALTLGSAADAARAERLARRAPLRLVV
jgi:hypothetical protein